MSTGPQAPVVLVSGPIVAELGLNNGICAIGPGSQNAANIAIGRAARLIMMNVGLSYPGISDMDTQGTTMKFAYCVAENEARNPWAPFRVTKGFSPESSTVTVNAPFSSTCLYDFQNHDPNMLVEVFASAMTSAAAAMGSAWLTTARGGPVPWLYTLGAPMKGVLWESTAAAEIHKAGRPKNPPPLPPETRLLHHGGRLGVGQLLGSWDKSLTPEAKGAHVKQCPPCQPTPTRWPSLQSVTPAPSLSMRPAIS